jgi:hypothetical protein
VGSSVDDIAGIFLEDLGIQTREEGNYREGEDTVDYLPVQRQDNGLERRSTDIPLSPSSHIRRLTGAEKRIIQEVREAGLVQEATLSLVERSIEMSGEARQRSIMKLLGEVKTLLTLRNLAQAESAELGQIMDAPIKRMIHDHFNDALKKHNMQEELDARLIEDVNKRLQSAQLRRSFWDDVFRRER